jgi:hypothetical protein
VTGDIVQLCCQASLPEKVKPAPATAEEVSIPEPERVKAGVIGDVNPGVKELDVWAVPAATSI